MPENQTVWKSDNQGCKEEIFIQTGMPRQGVQAVLLITQKQTQGGCQIEATKKYGPNERTDQNSKKRTK